MTTVVDPIGTPVPVYNRSGVTIVSLSVSATPPFVAIPRPSGWTVAVLTPTVGDPSVVLPDGADIGDVVEVHLLPNGLNTRVFVLAPAGETVDAGEVTNARGRLFRKISSTRWVGVGSVDRLDDVRTLQVVSFETGAVATGTTQIPSDDTVPQQTEGDERLSLSITPRDANSRLLVEVVSFVECSAVGGSTIAAALFRDNGANALKVGVAAPPGPTFVEPIAFRTIVAAGSTNTTTFKVRIGANAAATVTFNGRSGTRMYGGAIASSIVITEYLP